MKVRGRQKAFQSLATFLKKKRENTLLLHLLRAWLNCLDTAFGPCADLSLCGPLPSTLKMHGLDRQSPGTL